MRKGAILLAAGAVLLLAAGAAARFAVLPMVHQVPSNLDSLTRYSGTVSMINPIALASGDSSKLFLKDVPVKVEQRVKSVSVSGRTVVMSSDTTVKGPEGTTIIASNHVYALDRIALEAVEPPAGSNAERASGLALGFPLVPKPENYQYWDATTQTANPASYVRTDTKGGRNVYVYTTSAVGTVKDPKLQAALPPALPKSALPVLASNLPEFVQQALRLAMPLLPDSIPLTYASTTETTFCVDSATGIVLDVNQKQTIKAQPSGPLAAVPLPPVFDLSIKSTDESVTANAASAASAEFGLKLVGIYLPIGLGALGVIILLVAIIVALRRQPATAAAVADVGD